MQICKSLLPYHVSHTTSCFSVKVDDNIGSWFDSKFSSLKLKDLNDPTLPTKSNSTPQQRLDKLGSHWPYISNELNDHLEKLDENRYTLDDILQLNAEMLSKLNFAPKMNPRLKVIKEEEMKYSPAGSPVSDQPLIQPIDSSKL